MLCRRIIAPTAWAGWFCWLLISAAAAGPIHDAARDGDLAAVTRLLAEGAGIEERDATGETPLISASLAGRTEVVELLLAHHAMIEARNDRGLTALHAAAYGGHLPTVVKLIEGGAPVNDAENRYKTTPLIVAAEDGHTKVVKLLIEKEANLEATEANRFTALTQAWAVYKWDTVDVLLQAGAVCQPKEIVGELWATECNKRRQ